ncbi:hypothetical protein [Saccharothrix sp. 6-C]|uniref:hypothetical protein n=1 Tax=Saccharothrix sp. 6-C TaxID=2781735 RepID=UPI0019175041|nr:hypothetical protein [Saccharothrix sp. 6-C]
MIVAARRLTPVGYALAPLATWATTGLALLCAAQSVFFLSAILDAPVEMGYRQSVTPDRLMGRMNATMRSVNRAMIVFGALVGGVLADLLGNRSALWISVTGLVATATGMTFSAVRRARL